MQRHAKSGPDPSQPIRSTEIDLRAPVEDVSFDTDFANLAARFGAQSGGTLSLELCADLALEIVLNEIIEQACLATGATGAAIVLQRDGELVCRASSGATAPELGARLDRTSGISGECVLRVLTHSPEIHFGNFWRMCQDSQDSTLRRCAGGSQGRSRSFETAGRAVGDRNATFARG